MKPTAVHRHERSEVHPHSVPSPKRLQHRRDAFTHVDGQLHALRDALRAAGHGDFSIRLRTDGVAEGIMGEVALAFDAFIEETESLVRRTQARGSERWHLCRAVAERSATGQVLSWFGTFTDIEDQKRVQAIQASSRAHWTQSPMPSCSSIRRARAFCT